MWGTVTLLSSECILYEHTQELKSERSILTSLSTGITASDPAMAINTAILRKDHCDLS